MADRKRDSRTAKPLTDLERQVEAAREKEIDAERQADESVHEAEELLKREEALEKNADEIRRKATEPFGLALPDSDE